MFKHFIVTRFNLKNVQGFDKYKLSISSEEWLATRFLLFEKYCFPSIVKQTCRNFIWFVLFSSDTPEKYLLNIRKYELQFDCFKPVFLDRGTNDHIKEALNNEIQKYISISDKFVITSRVDNDDAFHIEMINEVQKHFEQNHNTFISFIYGYQFEIERKVIVLANAMNNHFVSKIEKISSGIETVIVHDHTYIDRFGKVNYVNNRNKPLWLEIIHGGNLANNLSPLYRPVIRKNVNDFGSKLEISLKNSFSLFPKYALLNMKIIRAEILKKLGIYNFLKGIKRSL
jgi:hypothetical protein